MEYAKEHKLPNTSEEQIDYHRLARNQVDRRMREYKSFFDQGKSDEFRRKWEEENKDLMNREIKK